MIQRLYIHNFRCLENFDLSLKDLESALLIGKNGVGKSTIAYALEVFQRIGRGINKVGDLVKPSDFSRGDTNVPMRFEIETLLNNKLYHYILALELPENFYELKILEERLFVDGKPIYSREGGQVSLHKNISSSSSFIIDWHLVALPIIQKQSDKDPLYIFQSWLARIMILMPIPRQMKGDSNGSTLYPERAVSNFGEWFTGLLLRYPAAYSSIDTYIRKIMPDFDSIENDLLAKDARSISIQFKCNKGRLKIDFDTLSDGEKCFFLSAMVLAANKYNEPFFCFWDEPDDHLSLPEISHFIMELRRSFKEGGQLLITSHNAYTIERFSGDNTFVLDRKTHLEPTLIRVLEDIKWTGDLITALTLGDIIL
ncbi:MAG: AAA family ATPase [Methylovulum sp.]|nr:AAA family ATPase [Methylovulum sp.]